MVRIALSIASGWVDIVKYATVQCSLFYSICLVPKCRSLSLCLCMQPSLITSNTFLLHAPCMIVVGGLCPIAVKTVYTGNGDRKLRFWNLVTQNHIRSQRVRRRSEPGDGSHSNCIVSDFRPVVHLLLKPGQPLNLSFFNVHIPMHTSKQAR